MEKSKTKKRVGILRGGKGKHYASSLKRGGEVIAHIFKNLSDKYKVSDILIDKEGIWHLNGVPTMPADLMHKVDVIWSTVHPSESIILDSLSIPYIGQNHFLLENNEGFLREHIKQAGIEMARHIVLPLYQKDFDGPRERYAIKKAKEIHEKFAGPWIVRSFVPDMNMGVHLAKTFPELVNAIEDGVKHEESITIEEFISGKVASVHSVSGFRGEDVYTFPIGEYFGKLSTEEKNKLMNFGEKVHKLLKTEHYLKSDFILGSRGKVYLLQLESMPSLVEGSHFSQVCESVGAKMHHVIDHILNNFN